MSDVPPAEAFRQLGLREQPQDLCLSSVAWLWSGLLKRGSGLLLWTDVGEQKKRKDGKHGTPINTSVGMKPM